MLVCLLAALAESLLTIDGGIAAQDQLHCIVIVVVGWNIRLMVFRCQYIYSW